MMSYDFCVVLITIIVGNYINNVNVSLNMEQGSIDLKV